MKIRAKSEKEALRKVRLNHTITGKIELLAWSSKAMLGLYEVELK